MDELTEIAKVVAIGGSPALVVWALKGALPVILSAVQNFLDWKLKYNQQTVDFESKEKIEVASMRLQLLENLRNDLKSARTEIAECRQEVADGRAEVKRLSDLEMECREEAAQLIVHNERMAASAQTMMEQLSGLKSMADKTSAILHVLETLYPELFLPGGPIDKALGNLK